MATENWHSWFKSQYWPVVRCSRFALDLLAFTPAGEIYYVQRRGALMRYDAELGDSVEVARLEVMDIGEYGLLGLAFDPGSPEFILGSLEFLR